MHKIIEEYGDVAFALGFNGVLIAIFTGILLNVTGR